MGQPSQPDIHAILALDAMADVGEGPVWHPIEQVLYWVDITPGKLHRFDPATGSDTFFDAAQPLGAAAPRMAGGFVLALRDGFGVLDAGTHDIRMIADTEAALPENRMNDGKCDARGRFWAGTMPFAETSASGSLYRLSPDHQVQAVAHDITISNGIDWSLDHSLMYYIDTATQGVDVFDFDLEAGTVANRRRLITVPDHYGMPDGMTVDAAGYLWVAFWGGWAVRRFAPDGSLDRTIRVGASQASSCAFGGPDLGDLYITSARRGLSPDELTTQPHAGGVFVARPGVTGREANFYAG
jgi:sugar lactone lactonase YvrE